MKAKRDNYKAQLNVLLDKLRWKLTGQGKLDRQTIKDAYEYLHDFRDWLPREKQ